MRIAFAMINCNRRDGSARAVNEVAEILARRGHEVHLFARTVADLDTELVQWHRVPGPGWPEVADFWTYHVLANRRFRKGGFDIIHSIGCNTVRANVVTIQNIQPVKRRILERLAAQERVSAARRLTRRMYLEVTSRAERRLYTRRPPPVFLPVSRGVANELRSEYPIGDAPVRIIPNAADTRVFHPLGEAERLAWRSAHGFQKEDVIAVFSGGEWARKGLDSALKAFARTTAPGLKLFVAGDDPDRARFEDLAAEAGDRVRFGGFRSDIATVLGAADLFLFPSHYEAFSLATIEAAACGLPVVATSINGTEDFIRPGVTGEFIDRDPAQISRVLDALALSPDRRLAMGRAARELVERDYTWERVATLTEEAYEEAVSR